jgi:prepilin-type processing-associated H-X9-DG protein
VRQPDGKLVFAGLAHSGPGGWLVGRMNADGTAYLTPPEAGSTSVFDLSLRKGGGILVGGEDQEAASRFRVRRFASRLTPGGLLDPEYGTGSVACADTFAQDVVYGPNAAFDADGRVYLPARGSGGQASVTRITAAGAVDAGFGSGGTATVELTPRHNSGRITNFLFADGHAQSIHKDMLPKPETGPDGIGPDGITEAELKGANGVELLKKWPSVQFRLDQR